MVTRAVALCLTLAGLSACDPRPSPPTETADSTMAESTDSAQATKLAQELEPSLLHGMDPQDRARGQALLRDLTTDWVREARSDPDLEVRVLEILREDLDKKTSDAKPRRRLAVLTAEVLDRRLRPLAVAARQLGRAAIDEPSTDMATQGRTLLEDLKPLGANIAPLPDDLARPLRRELEESTLDALYAVERKAMSRRLARYARSKGAPAPPDIRPAQ
jgi:hypothetical protein